MSAVAVPQDLTWYSQAEMDPELFDRLVRQIVKQHPEFSTEQAEEIMDAAIGFLMLEKQFPGHGFVPSALVDVGWHVFILHTQEYQQFCGYVFGRIIHHHPTDPASDTNPGDTAQDTVDFMDRHGIAYNPAMWDSSADCGMCRSSCQLAD